MFFAIAAALAAVWALLEPAEAVAFFDQDGRSPFELMTLPVFAAVVPAVWIFCPFGGSRLRRVLLCSAVTLVVVMAVAKELDFHAAALHWLYPDCVGDGGALVRGKFFKPNGSVLSGTPFKMRVLTNAAVPLGMKAAIVFYFAAFFGVFAAGLLWFLPAWIKGVFALEQTAWCFGCLGASGVVVQIADRLPSWLDHAFGLDKHAAEGVSALSSLCTVFEEGMEMAIAVFALMTVFSGWARLRRLRRGQPDR